MTINEIEKRIIEEAEAEALKIKEEADNNIRQLDKVHQQKKEEIKLEILKAARQEAEAVKTSLLVPARLKGKKSLLLEKQQILGELYARVQKENKLKDAEINRVREDSEVNVGRILFGEQK